MKNFIFLLICTPLIGCSPVYYVPNTQNVPVIKEKGQTNVSFNINESESTDGIEFQGAYGLTDKIALQFNTDWVKSSDDASSGSGYLYEIGPGYYNNLSKHFVFETYGLFGLGRLKYEKNDAKYLTINANFFRIGVQPSISFTSKYFNASLSTRLANLNYNSVNGNFYDVEYLKANNSQWLFEPALTLQFGFENIKLQLQYQHSINLTDSNFIQDFDLFSLGLKVNFSPSKD